MIPSSDVPANAAPNQPVELEQGTLEQSTHIHDEENMFHWFSPGMLSIYAAIILSIVGPAFLIWWKRKLRHK